MNPKQLLQHFDRVSEAPDAIVRLRRFILDLAVRGKLVEQDPNDEPAAELLKRIQAEKDRLGLTPRRQGAKKSEKADQETLGGLAAWREMPFLIPSNWGWSQLVEIGFISPRNAASDDLLASFVPMPMISADYGIPNQHQIRPWDEIKSGYTHFAEGDVGLAKITPCFENGKSTVFRGLTGGIGAGTTELHIVRPIFVNADYVLIFLKCPHFIESGIPKMTGTAGQKRVPTEYFSRSPFPLPPLAEQHRIVAKVDELMALCDQLQAAQTEREQSRDRLVAASLHRIGDITQSRHSGRDCRTNPPGADLHPPEGCRAGQPGLNPEHKDVNVSNAPLLRFDSEHQSAEVMEAKPAYVPVDWIPAIPRQSLTGAGSAGMTVTDSADFVLQHLPRLTTRPAHIKQLRQTILNLAVRGKLVAQDPNDEPAAQLLDFNDTTRQAKEKEDRRADADQQTLLAEEERWAVPLSWVWRGLADLVLFIDYRGKTPLKITEGIRLITAKNVKKGFINLSPEEFLTEPDYHKWMTRGLPKIGDVLFTTEAPMGNAAVVRLSEDFALAQRVICFRPYGALNSDFLVLQLLAEPFQSILDKTATGMTAKGIKAAKLKRLPIAVPPLAEQHRIVAKVDELMALCDKLEVQLASTEADSRCLLEALLRDTLDSSAVEIG